MNKQDILKQIEWHLEETEGENASGTFDQGYKEGCYHCEALIEQLDDPKKVKVPAFVAEKMKRYKSALWMLSSEYFDTSLEVDSDELANWIDKNSEKFFRAWLDGYEVEEEPKYYVQLPFLEWNEEAAELEQTELYLGFDITSDETRFMTNKNGYRDFKTRLDEETIKAIDKRYWPFAVPVEKVEA